MIQLVDCLLLRLLEQEHLLQALPLVPLELQTDTVGLKASLADFLLQTLYKFAQLGVFIDKVGLYRGRLGLLSNCLALSDFEGKSLEKPAFLLEFEDVLVHAILVGYDYRVVLAGVVFLPQLL